VVQAECSGKLQECQMICNTDRVHPSTCATTCNAYYQCGTDRAPPSYLQTENPTDTPSYNGPPKDLSAANNNNASNNGGSSQSSNSVSVYNNNNKSLYLFIMATGIMMTGSQFVL
jgi:hypothetical protein